MEVGGHLEFTDGGEEPRAVRPQPAVLLTEPKLHSEEVTLEQTGGHRHQLRAPLHALSQQLSCCLFGGLKPGVGETVDR